jgi:hypothetical protein
MISAKLWIKVRHLDWNTQKNTSKDAYRRIIANPIKFKCSQNGIWPFAFP